MKKIWLVVPSAAALLIGVPGLASASRAPSATHHSYIAPAAGSTGHKLVLVHPAHPFETHPLQRNPVQTHRLPGHTKFSTVSSNNWSGFATYGDHFRFVRTTYTIPSLNCAISPDGSYDSQWVGLDGYTDGTVEQVGTYAQCSGGTPSYYGFYEMYPNPSVQLTGVSPGDSITATVFFNKSPKEWHLSLADNTTQNVFSQDFTCPAGNTCQNANAEVISEVPNGGPPTASLADYGTVGFTQVAITDTAGHHDNFLSKYWKNDKIYEVDLGNNDQMQVPGTLEGSESGTGGGYGNQAFIDTAVAPS
jgi:hypothetical protein